MGKFEKFVVLTVLFLVTLILVVSLNTSEPETLAHASLGGVEEVTPAPILEVDPEPLALWKPVDVEEPETAVFDPSTALLLGKVEEEVAMSYPEVMLPEGSLLCETIGLSETVDPNLFMHAVVEGETYESLALQYYGDASLKSLLRQANDDLQDVPTGESVMLPAFDLRVKTADRLSCETYIVAEGDTFTGISLKHYGDADLWRQIYEANTDQVSSPTGLRPGMTIKIPDLH